MRHLGSIVLAIVFAPLMYLLAGYGQVRFVIGTAGETTHWSDVSIGIVAIVAAAGLYSILVMARFSPLGPFLAALAFITVELWAVFDQAGLVKLLGTSTLGIHGAQEAPLAGLALFIAIPLLATIVSPRRWRGRELAMTAPIYQDEAAPTYAPEQATADTAADADQEKSEAVDDATVDTEADREDAKAETK